LIILSLFEQTDFFEIFSEIVSSLQVTEKFVNWFSEFDVLLAEKCGLYSEFIVTP
jgi:hypothetical protein